MAKSKKSILKKMVGKIKDDESKEDKAEEAAESPAEEKREESEESPLRKYKNLKK